MVGAGESHFLRMIDVVYISSTVNYANEPLNNQYIYNNLRLHSPKIAMSTSQMWIITTFPCFLLGEKQQNR